MYVCGTTTTRRKGYRIMKPFSMRELLPDRRNTWTQRVTIEGHELYLCVGEYDDGRVGEIFVDVSKEGTFVRGVMSTLARVISICLQCGADVHTICHALRGIDFPPSGQVIGSNYVTECYSIADWIASELEVRYINRQIEDKGLIQQVIGEGDPIEDKPVPRHISSNVWG